jgi:hypothetical protein
MMVSASAHFAAADRIGYRSDQKSSELRIFHAVRRCHARVVPDLRLPMNKHRSVWLWMTQILATKQGQTLLLAYLIVSVYINL